VRRAPAYGRNLTTMDNNDKDHFGALKQRFANDFARKVTLLPARGAGDNSDAK